MKEINLDAYQQYLVRYLQGRFRIFEAQKLTDCLQRHFLFEIGKNGLKTESVQPAMLTLLDLSKLFHVMITERDAAYERYLERLKGADKLGSYSPRETVSKYWLYDDEIEIIESLKKNYEPFHAERYAELVFHHFLYSAERHGVSFEEISTMYLYLRGMVNLYRLLIAKPADKQRSQAQRKSRQVQGKSSRTRTKTGN